MSKTTIVFLSLQKQNEHKLQAYILTLNYSLKFQFSHKTSNKNMVGCCGGSRNSGSERGFVGAETSPQGPPQNVRVPENEICVQDPLNEAVFRGSGAGLQGPQQNLQIPGNGECVSYTYNEVICTGPGSGSLNPQHIQWVPGKQEDTRNEAGLRGAGASPQRHQQNFQKPGKKRCVSDSHNESVCHGTGERRRDLIDQLKIFMSEFDERPCQSTPPQTGPDSLRPLGSYKEYMQKHCQSWMPPNPRPPLVTSVQTHEVRPTEDYKNKQHENNEYITYTDARIKPPVNACECVKRNGLQDQCSHPDCKPPTAKCLATNPGPCCPPSFGLTNREMAQGMGPPQKQVAPPQSSLPANVGPWNPNNHNIPPTNADLCTPNKQILPGQQQGVQFERFNTTQQDYRDHGPQGCFTSQQYGGPGIQQQQQQMEFQAKPGMKMVCLCKTSPANMPTGKKYICCPVPQ